MTEPAPQEKTIPVVAAVIREGERYLVGRRPPEKRHGGMWEFPGGKLLAGESLLDAARRELGEELGLEVTGLGRELFRTRDPGSPFEIRFVEVSVRGAPRATEHTELGWFTAGELAAIPLAPADARFVREGTAGDN